MSHSQCQATYSKLHPLEKNFTEVCTKVSLRELPDMFRNLVKLLKITSKWALLKYIQRLFKKRGYPLSFLRRKLMDTQELSRNMQISWGQEMEIEMWLIFFLSHWSKDRLWTGPGTRPSPALGRWATTTQLHAGSFTWCFAILNVHSWQLNAGLILTV